MTLKSIRIFLKQPYPFYYEGKGIIIFTAIIFLMSISFLYFFKPFNNVFSEHKFSFFIISLIHSFIAVFSFLSLVILLKRFPKTIDNWNIFNEFLFLAILLFLIGLGQFLIRDFIYDNPNNKSFFYFIEEIRNTFFVGILFALIIVPLNFNRLYKINSDKANSFAFKKTKQNLSKKSNSIFIKTNLKNEAFNLDVSEFLFARSDGNYLGTFSKFPTV